MSIKPIVLVVMDGVGVKDSVYGNAVKTAYTPILDELFVPKRSIEIKAHGTYVGLPSDEDMGNSEVGHNAIGSGQIYNQGAKLVNQAIETGALFESATWKDLIEGAKGHKLHFIGLLSDGNIHSHIKHLEAMIAEAKKEGVTEVRLHVLLDGRDVPETSALEYVDRIETFMASLNDATFHSCIASGGGRMKITMDRYEANWKMVEEGWKTHVLGEGRMFPSATDAIETYRQETRAVDQDLPAFVIEKDGKPVGTIEDGDSVIFYNFRGDRAQEISLAFDREDFTAFDRIRHPKVKYAGMLQYDADLKIPYNYLTEPPKIRHTLTEELLKHGIRQYAISETQKFGHVTYFWNGNKSGKFDEAKETYVEIPSDIVPFEQRPWMKSSEITDALVEAITSGNYDFLRVNYPNGDMVGHTGHFEATVIGVESVDLQLERLKKAVDQVGGILIVTADHGNADEMYEKQKKDTDPIKPKTSHTLSEVPLIIYGTDVTFKEGDFGLANIAATVTTLFGFEPNPNWKESLIK